MQDQLDALTADRQVGWRTGVITMDAMGGLLTGGADRLRAHGTRRNGQGGLTTRDLLEFKPREGERKGTQEEAPHTLDDC